jgi:hypothetical protein
MSGSLQFASRGIKPVFSASIGHTLDEHTVGYLTYSTNLRLEIEFGTNSMSFARVRESEDSMELVQEESGMCTMVVRDTEKYNMSLSLQLGIPYTYAMLSYTRKLPEQKRKCR